jgi:hypothetical protein
MHPPIAIVSKTYATIDADVDLVAVTPDAVAGLVPGRVPFAIRCGGAGALHVQYESGVEDTVTFLAGETMYARVRRVLDASTTATAVTVLWGAP